MTKVCTILSIIFLSITPVVGQSDSIDDEEITIVFNKLVNAFGNTKSAPALLIVENITTPAYYKVSPSPSIVVDRKLYELCNKFGTDNLNAISIVISHELAHYYNDDTFCTDFAFAIKDKNISLKNQLKTISKSEKLKLETKADRDGLYYAKIAGYEPFNIYPNLLDEIYRLYQLEDPSPGYPSKDQRKDINGQVQQNVIDLYEMFKQGIDAYKNEDYNLAIEKFEELNKFFPSRENYNNLGVSKTAKILLVKPITRAESKYPNRFEYPLGIDKNSRLAKPKAYRNHLSDFKIEEMNTLLKSAQRDFEKAISLDSNYTQSYINLACVFNLLGNHNAAIGKILELPIAQQKTMNAQRILAIAYYNNDQEIKAEEIWSELNLGLSTKY